MLSEAGHRRRSGTHSAPHADREERCRCLKKSPSARSRRREREALRDELGLLERIEALLAAAAGRLQGDEQFRARLNGWLAARVGALTERHKHEVAAFVAAQVKSWDARQAVRAIELAIGKDLQYIRVNGTLVGGLIGLSIFGATRLA